MTLRSTVQRASRGTASVATVSPAGAGLRVTAYLIDLVVVLVSGGLWWYFTRAVVPAGIVAVEAWVGLTLARAALGVTPGGWATRTVANAAGTDHAPGLRAEGIRSVIFGALHLTAIGPLVTTALSREGQDWIDKVAGTAASDTRGEARASVARVVTPGASQRAATDSWSGFAPGQAAAAPVEPASVAPSLAPPSDARRAYETMPSIPTTPRLTSAQPMPMVQAPAPIVAAQMAPAPTVSTPAPIVPALPPVWIVLDSGMRAELVGVAVLGRAPAAQEGTGELEIAIPDPTRSLSRTHVRLGRDVAGVWVEDAFSGNGTSALLPDGRLVELVRGERTAVPLGTTLIMGERRLTLTGPA